MSETFRKEIVQRITRNLLDIQIMRLIQVQPMWGYMIKKQAETRFEVTLRHGALYPLLNSLEKSSFVTSKREMKRGRTRKVYEITQKGREYVQTYHDVLKDQIHNVDIT